MPAELTCIVSNGPRSEWVNGSSLFGELTGGYVFKVSVTQARKYDPFMGVVYFRLLDPSCTILQTIGSQIPYECAIGLNGYVSSKQRAYL